MSDEDVLARYEQVHLPEAWRKEPFDLVCSLGGNCSAAHNLLIRKLRPEAYPLDWVFIADESSIRYLASAFQTHFKDFCLRENLVELQGDERGTEHGFLQYKDLHSGYRFVNHFPEPIEQPGAYDSVAKTQRRRIERLYCEIAQAKRVLFILGTAFPINHQALQPLQAALEAMWPDKAFYFALVSFGAEKPECVQARNLIQWRYCRKTHLYDFTHTSYEWAFLDEVRLCANKNRGGACRRTGARSPRQTKWHQDPLAIPPPNAPGRGAALDFVHSQPQGHYRSVSIG